MFLDENNPDGIYTDVEFVGYFDDNPVYEAIFDDMSGACIGYPFYILVTPDGVRFSDDEEGAKFVFLQSEIGTEPVVWRRSISPRFPFL